MGFIMRINEYENQIKELVKDLPKGAKISYSSIATWNSEGRPITNFRIKQEDNVEGFNVEYSSGISCDILNYEENLLEVKIHPGVDDNVLDIKEAVRLSLLKDKEDNIRYIKPYIT